MKWENNICSFHELNFKNSIHFINSYSLKICIIFDNTTDLTNTGRKRFKKLLAFINVVIIPKSNFETFNIDYKFDINIVFSNVQSKIIDKHEYPILMKLKRNY